MNSIHVPVATYRVQLNPAFGFAAARALAPYLSALGITDFYASPLFLPRKGSPHGYDVVDPTRLNPELGSEEEFAALVDDLKRHGLSWLQDIVPNHMAYDGQNRMLMDVIENGPSSEFYNYFDIDWNHPYESIRGRVLAPFLGEFYAECLERGEIRLRYDAAGLSVNYYDLRLPLKIESYNTVFSANVLALRRKLGGSHPDIIKLLGVLYTLKNLPSVEDIHERADQVRFVKSMLWELYTTNPDIQRWVDEHVARFNGVPGRPETFSALDQLLSEQLFRLSFWKVAAEEINYRRFFNINELISVRIEDEKVLHSTHRLILKLVADGKFAGLRVDHIDGLYDPSAYLQALRQKAPEAYLIVEKILALDEELPQDWPVQGTTGYDFANYVNGIFCDRDNERRFTQIYARFAGPQKPYLDLVSDKKRLIIGKYMAGDVDDLAHLLKGISSRDRYGSDITLYGLRRALVEVLTFFPVYRSYVTAELYRETDREHIQTAVRRAKIANPGLIHELNFIERFLLLHLARPDAQDEKPHWLRFVMRFQQFTGPLMAKGFEDTLLYVYNRLLSLNEVGGEPGQFGLSVRQFHAFNEARARRWPHTLNATSTHDTKRGEDARARINVLSEIPDEWEKAARSWSRINRAAKQLVREHEVPDRNDEYFLYQTLIGSFPLAGANPEYVARLKGYMIKAVREAKVHTEWLRPDEAYEEAFMAFIDKIIAPAEGNLFLSQFLPFVKKIAFHGMLNSLSQTVLKIFAPGVPDFYQGTELWDLSFVDPDNRRPVDFAARADLLRELKEWESQNPGRAPAELLDGWEDGRIKFYLTYKALQFRNARRDLFFDGDYLGLRTAGPARRSLCAFARRKKDLWCLVAAPRLTTRITTAGKFPLGEKAWQTTAILLPERAPERWLNVMTGDTVQSAPSGRQRHLAAETVFRSFPVAFLEPA
ncbi:MAG TPA: malto-oligosyltrehalose synthase [Candidatus Acidoferrales bacterium]|nr:malto-oligosyltrehalose synthase [Candidatus Acidoferrales bacterium]